MEEVLEAAFSVGLSEAEFWDQTPYLTWLAIRGRLKQRREGQLATGWWVSRFAVEREPRLSSLQHYLREPKPDDADDGDALVAGFAMMHGLKVEDVEATDG